MRYWKTAAILVLLLNHTGLASEKSKKSHRVLRTRGVHVVTYAIPTLGEISLFLYGTTRRSGDIARWNRLTPPFVLKEGQRLILKEPPKLTPEQGNSELLAMWRKRMGLPADPNPAIAAPIATPKERPEVTKLLLEARRLEEAREKARAENDLKFSAEYPAEESPQDLFKSGHELHERGKNDAAVAKFRSCREKDSRFMGAWFFEMKLLRNLGREEELRETVATFLKQFPGMAALPAIRSYQSGTREIPPRETTSEHGSGQ